VLSFFKKKKEVLDNTTSEEENTRDSAIRASITFFIKDNGDPYVEANLKEVGKEDVLLMSELLAALAKNQFLDSTIELVRDFLIEQGRPELFLLLAEQIAALAYEGKIAGDKEEPYIKPSDAI
tara:strand:- start:1043 stop:1411 length:369 start_codon:yes stop_codon:yes gene_type:complete